MSIYLHKSVTKFLNKLIDQSASNPEYFSHKEAITTKIKGIAEIPWEFVADHDDAEIQCKDPRIIKLLVKDYDIYEVMKQRPQFLSPDQYYEISIVFGEKDSAVLNIDLMVK